MKYNKLFLIFFLTLFIFIFKESIIIKQAIIESVNVWFEQILCIIIPTYFIIDLLLNYGITNYIKSNKIILIFISLLLGSPSNAKYINEFLEDNLIDEKTAKHLLFSIYSPSLLFLLALNYYSYKLVSIIYLINIILYFTSKPFFKTKEKNKSKIIKVLPFTKRLELSIKNSLNISLLILGIVCFYKIILVFLNSLNLNNLGLLLELTNTTHIIIKNNLGFTPLLFICLFGGISVHTQVKSIVNDYYKFFLYGRVISLILFILITPLIN